MRPEHCCGKEMEFLGHTPEKLEVFRCDKCKTIRSRHPGFQPPAKDAKHD